MQSDNSGLWMSQRMERTRSNASVHSTEDEGPICMPNERQCLRIGILSKKSIDTKGVAWLKRLLMLTDDMLLFSRVDDPERRVVDYIHLCDIVECDVKEDEDSQLLSDVTDIDAMHDPRLKDKRMLEVVFRTKEESRNCGRSYIYRSTYQVLGGAGWWMAFIQCKGYVGLYPIRSPDLIWHVMCDIGCVGMETGCRRSDETRQKASRQRLDGAPLWAQLIRYGTC